MEQHELADNVAVWAAPALARDSFQPTIIVSVARITPAIDTQTLFDRLDDTAATLPEWRPRAHARSTEDEGRSVSDTLGDYRLDRVDLTASTIVTAWLDGDSTILRQIVVTTFADQLPAHSDAHAVDRAPAGP